MQFTEDLQQIQTLIGDAFSATGKLVVLSNAAQHNPESEAEALSKIATHFEQATLQIRRLCERHTQYFPTAYTDCGASTLEIAGSLDLFSEQWVHIRLQTLLPHCKYQTPSYLNDTLLRLLNGYEKNGRKLPYFQQAVLVIDEHSQVDGRHVYDQDNKGWKAIPNALKGRVIGDDDQYHLGVVLLSKPSPENVTHITILHPQDLPDFFALRDSDYTSELLYRGF
ncbi:hypothetical protein RFF05_08410 [Bengtsoniella intestinalis]|uniref:hypothetical protein n=1 Tax=Bengtsoniella intestinalis TaxID=3073143 RepID=UPI00391FC659